MNLSAYTLLVTYFMALLGFSAVVMVKGVGASFVIAAGGFALLSAYFNFTGKTAFRDALWNIFASFILLFFVADYLSLSGSLIISAARLLTLLLTLKLYGLKKNSDYLIVFGLVFFQILAAATSTISPMFFVLLTLFVLSGIWAMIMFTVKKDWLDSSQKELPSIEFGWPFFVSVVFISFASLAVIMILFFLLPRLSQGLLQHNNAEANRTTGFSDRVNLGDIAPFKTNSTVIMRVTPESTPVERIYLRGTAFDQYDGVAWSKPEKKEVLLKRSTDGRFYLNNKHSNSPALVLDIMLEPLDSEYLVTASGAFAVSGAFNNLWYKPSTEAIHLSSPPFEAIEYWVRVDKKPGKSPAPESRYSSTVYLDSSPEGQRVVELTKTIVAGETDDLKKALKIQSYLQKNYTYNLNPAGNGKHPLEDFLFRTKEGFCQHYATAMALMLRVAGIPSRVVNGYQEGEWNEYGNYYIVRQSDAHSWVEAYIDGKWLTTDPTPPSLLASSMPSRIFKFLDYWRLRWTKHIVNFSVEDQKDLAVKLEGRASRLLAFLKDPSAVTRSLSGKAFLAVVILAGVVLALRAVRNGASKRSANRTPPFYTEMTKILKKKGVLRRPDETPLEFAARLNNPSVDLITKAYHEERYGRGIASKTVLDEVNSAVEGLRDSEL